jgi:hypothetical protein
VLEASRARILEIVDNEDLVLDVGGGGAPFDRADWVLDLLAYEGRGLYGPPPDPARERFGPETWVQRDMCAREPWPFADHQFDFSVCSHTLEDVRDPIFVCGELIRVSRAGYIEVPSRLEEQSYGVHGPWAGWSHHRWLIDIVEDGIEFVFKSHVLHNRVSDHFPPGFHGSLTPEQRVSQLWWTGSFSFGERIFLEAAPLDEYLSSFVSSHLPAAQGRGLRGLLRRAPPGA